MRERANALVAELLERLARDGVRELEVARDGIRVRVVRDHAAAASPDSAAPAAQQAREVPRSSLETAPARTSAAAANTVVAPLTGIFYRSPSPQSPAFVQVGSVVAHGDVIGLIEAMKLFNEIRSTASGKVKRIVAEDGKLVRAHATILEVE